ncbi:MAG: hypothetical protein EPO25_07535 [Gammaproteobacteria bacterium]|nr:MAG: hypothetical protein EPO25_07535 [Gammaproteobacteria bacterium]
MAIWTTLTPQQQERLWAHAVRTADMLRTQAVESGSRAVSYLLFTNAGGAIALLTFMGGAPMIPRLAWWSLAVFVIGTFSVGVLNAISYHTSYHLNERYVRAVDLVVSDTIDTKQLVIDPGLRKIAHWAAVFGYFAFVAFITGSALGIAAYLC